MHQAKFLLGLAALVFSNSLSHASISVVPTQPAVLPGYTAYGIYWDGGGTQDWTSATIDIQLTSGMFYQNPFGSDSPPSPAFFSIFPELEFDTYVGIIGDGTAGISGNCNNDLGGGPCGIHEQFIDIVWFNSATNNTGLVKIGNFTVSNDAMGVWSILSGGTQTSGIIIPEPTTLVLLALTCPLPKGSTNEGHKHCHQHAGLFVRRTGVRRRVRHPRDHRPERPRRLRRP